MRSPRFSRYVSEQNQLNGDVSEELAMLEGVLKEEQMEWLKAVDGYALLEWTVL